MRYLRTLQDQIYDAQETFAKDETLIKKGLAHINRKPMVRRSNRARLTDARMIRGVFERFMTCIQYQPNTPPRTRANVNEGTLYMPSNESAVIHFRVDL